jgi:hypothetical protein
MKIRSYKIFGASKIDPKKRSFFKNKKGLENINYSL